MISAVLSLKWLPKKPAGKPETAVFLSEKPETAGFPKSQDCPQPNAQVAMRFSNGRWVRQVTLMSDEKAAFSRPRAEPSLELELNQWPCLFECLNKTDIESLKAAYAAESRMEDLRRTADQAERGLLSQ